MQHARLRHWLLVVATLGSSLACGGSSHGTDNPASAGTGAGTIVSSAGSSAGGDASGSAAGGASGDPATGGATSRGGSALSGDAGQGGSPSASAGKAGAGGANGGAGAGGGATLGCAAWQEGMFYGPEITAAISDHTLVINRTADAKTYQDGPLLSQAGLSGDFDITIAWSAFTPGNATPFVGPTFQAGVFWFDPSGSVSSATGSVGADTVRAAIVHGNQFTINSISPALDPTAFADASGSFRVQRASSMMTVTTTINGKLVSAQSTEAFPEEPLTLRLSMSDSESGVGTGGPLPSGVTVTKVSVDGGGRLVKSDDFSCP